MMLSNCLERREPVEISADISLQVSLQKKETWTQKYDPGRG